MTVPSIGRLYECKDGNKIQVMAVSDSIDEFITINNSVKRDKLITFRYMSNLNQTFVCSNKYFNSIIKVI